MFSALRPKKRGVPVGYFLFDAATMSSAWFGGTTRSPAPWKKITGAERRSTWLMGERSA